MRQCIFTDHRQTDEANLPKKHKKMQSNRRQGGFTLAEVLAASVILALAVLSITQMIVAGQVQSHEALHHRRGQSLAEALMDEILSRAYPADTASLGAGSGMPRIVYHMGHYHGFSEDLGEVEDAHGELYEGPFERFSRAVQMQAVSKTVSGLGDPVPGLEITITVTDDRGMTWTVSRFVPEPAS